MTDRILWNRRPHGQDPGDIDEIVINHPMMVHVEQLDTRCWWIGIYLNEDGEQPRRWSGHFSADSRGRMTFTEQDNDITWDRDESHEAPPFNPDPDLDASIRVPPRRRRESR